MSHRLPYPHSTSAAATATMRANRRTDTGPEVAVRSLLHRHGLRFRKDMPITAGTFRVRPDIVFPRRQVSIFIDGCFWHRCPKHSVLPNSNVEYWRPKLERNVRRDQAVDSALRRDGWTVLRIWEHVRSDVAAEQIISLIRETAGCS